jgi:hypothetical protein
MNKTVLGFVINVFGGRAGLFTATILPVGANTAPITVRVSDIDGEPERFNERLLKTRLFREALTNVEPVEVSYEEVANYGNEVTEVRRMGRAHHLRPLQFDKLTGLVLRVRVHEQDVAAQPEEVPDEVFVTVLDPDPSVGVVELRLSMQMAERQVAVAMLGLIERALADGSPLEFIVARREDSKIDRNEVSGEGWIVSVSTASLPTAERAVDAFVESVSTCMVHNWPMGMIYLRTAPAMTGVARVVDHRYFRPQPVVAVVNHGSPMFELLDRARAEGARVRVGVGESRREATQTERRDLATGELVVSGLSTGGLPTELSLNPDDRGSRDPATIGLTPRLLVGVTVMAPLASAATPVWIRVQREALDGPPVVECAGGVPSSDLSGHGVMSLQVPHRAAWIGEGCFNPGVYRIQVVAPRPPRIVLDGEPLDCVSEYAHATLAFEPSKTDVNFQVGLGEFSDARQAEAALSRLRKASRFLAHFCVCRECCHELRIEFQEWRCGDQFELDVFKLC